MDADLRAHTQRLLVRYFTIPEIKDLCFELGVSYEELSFTTLSEFARELILYCERHALEGCLAEMMCHARPFEEIIKLFGQTTNCNPRSKIQIVIKTEGLVISASEIAKALAQIVGGIDPNQIHIVGIARGSIRLLVSIDQSSNSQGKDIQASDAPNITVTPFDRLSEQEQLHWKAGVADGRFSSKQKLNQQLRHLLERYDELTAFTLVNRHDSLLKRIGRRIAVGISTLLIIAFFAFVILNIGSGHSLSLVAFLPLALSIVVAIGLINFTPQLLGMLLDRLAGWRLFSAYGRWHSISK